MADDYAQVIATLERAGEVLMSPPDRVSDLERRAAEQCFLELRNSKNVPLPRCKAILERSQSPFVIHQTISALRECTLREWMITNGGVIEEMWMHLMQYAIERPGLPSYVSNEILMSVAMILKRAIFDKKAGDIEMFYTGVESLIQSNEASKQTLACQALLSYCQEFQTSWRTADVGMTWDFHIRAKREFESGQLRRIFEMVVQILSAIMNDESAANTESKGRLYAHFVRVAECILTWPFGSKMLPKRLNFAVEFGGPPSALRPPQTWRDLMLNPYIVPFFFKLHTRIRKEPVIAHDSLQCLAQLSSMIGEVFHRLPDETEQYMKAHDGRRPPELRDAHVAAIVNNLLQAFADENMNPTMCVHEANGLCIILSKLFTYHPLPTIIRATERLDALVTFIVKFAHQLAPHTMEAVMNDVDDTTTRVECLSRLFDAWSSMIRARERVLMTAEQEATTGELIVSSSQSIFDVFVESALAPPLGTRPAPTDDLNQGLDGDEGDVGEDDRDMYAELLQHLGVIARTNIAHTLDRFATLLDMELAQLSQFLSNIDAVAGTKELEAWQEDMHWLFMIIGHTLCRIDTGFTGSSELGEGIERYCNGLLSSHTDARSTNKAYLVACVEQPEQAMQADTTKVDPVIRILVWCVIEHRLLCDSRLALLSPEVMRTTVWLLRVLTSALTPDRLEEDEDEGVFMTEGYTAYKPSSPTGIMGILATGTPLSQLLTDLCVQKAFTILNIWSGERRLAHDTVALLVSFSDSRARVAEIANESHLLSQLAQTNIPSLSPATRKDLMRALVVIGSATGDENTHQRLHDAILKPLSGRYMSLIQQSSTAQVSSTYSDIVDLLDCFVGVALATDVMNARYLFEYLRPILQSCPMLLSVYATNQPIVDGVLSLYAEVTKRLAIYLDSDADAMTFYRWLLTLLDAYARNQSQKYSGAVRIDSEEGATDLLLLTDMLANILPRDLLSFSAVTDENAQSTEPSAGPVDVALAGLNVLLPLMSPEILHFPTLCKEFYHFLLFVIELYTTRLFEMANAIDIYASGALTEHYGKEALRYALEMIRVIARYLSSNELSIPTDTRQALVQHIGALTPLVFECCLRHSCEVELLAEASTAYLALKEANPSSNEDLIRRVLTAHDDNRLVRERLEAAFVRLWSLDGSDKDDGTEVSQRRNMLATSGPAKERRFRERFEAFLNDIAGLLCLQRINSVSA